MSSPLDPLRDYIPDNRRNEKSKDQEAMDSMNRVVAEHLKSFLVDDNSMPAPPAPKLYVLESGDILHNVHSPERCHGTPCAIHHPSQHPLHSRPRFWHNDMIYRYCTHGVLHPDYDSIAYLIDRDGRVQVHHPCCTANCCGLPELVTIDD